VPTKQHAVKQGLPRVIVGIATLGLTFSMAVLATGYAAESGAPIAATRRVELVKLVRQDCGSCHGLTLNGGLGPALLPEALKDKPADSLKSVILHGRPHTAMPPWQRFLSEADAEWIVFNLQKGFPGGD
jgi:cytochrome c55X